MKKIGIIGLGRMGSNMALNLLDKKINLVVYNRSPKPTKQLAKKGAISSYSLKELCEKLGKNKTVLMMIPAGKPVDLTIKELKNHLEKGDTIIDGGNSFYKDSIRRHKDLKKTGIHFLDMGTSGGMEGARRGACTMIGGDKKVYKKTEWLFRTLSVKDGYGHMGESGSGHFVKMVHNGIEYGMMGSIDEGFLALEKQKKFKLNLKEVAKVYSHGSIIESRLMSWLYNSFQKDHYLDNISCEVPKGETENEMKQLTKMSNMKILEQAIKMRENSRKGTICGQLISAMRNQFGGHAVKKR